MPNTLSFPRAVLAAAVILLPGALLPAVARADAGWQAPTPISGGAAPVSAIDSGIDPTKHNRIAVSPDGSVTAFWLGSDGTHLRVAFSTRTAASRSWSTAAYATPTGEDVGEYTVASDDAGNVTVAWMGTGSYPKAYARSVTLTAGADHFGDTTELATGSIAGLSLVRGPSHTVVAAMNVHDGSDDHVVFRSLAAGSATWLDGGSVETNGNSSAVALAFNAAGDGIAVWRQWTGSADEVQAAHLSAGGSWPATAGTVAAGHADVLAPVVDRDGNVTVSWIGGDSGVYASTLPATTGVWSPMQQISPGPNNMLLTSVVDDSGDVMVSWQFLSDYDNFYFGVQAVTRDERTGVWSSAVELPYSNPGGGPALVSDSAGDVALLYFGATDQTNPSLYVAAHIADSSTWDEPVPLTIKDVDYQYGVIASVMDEAGDISAIWGSSHEGQGSVGFSVLDGTAASLNDLAVPATGTAGDELSLSVNPFDLWSSVTTSWDFGDGTGATGTSVSHAYDTAGEETVTVTATDAAGNTSSTTRTVRISAPTPPAVTPPKPKPKPTLLPPVIEAQLVGRMITLNARVTLTAGRKCGPKTVVTATTKFGNTTYRTTLKLKRDGKLCRGTGTIKLKKTPSARTKLTIQLRGAAKSRDLATKRG